MTFWRSMLTNHPLVNILFLVVIIMGVMAYATMPREQDPEINFNWVNVTTVLPGASTADVEQLVTSPLEDAIRTVPDIRFVSSNSRESVSTILVRFRDVSTRVFDKRINDLRREVQNKANAELPTEAEDPRILEITSSNGFPTALIVVTGQSDGEELRRQARTVKDDIERMAGVDTVLALGLHDPEMHVVVSPEQLAARGLLATDVADALQRSFRDVSAGKVRVGSEDWLVSVQGTSDDPAQIARLRLPTSNSASQTLDLDAVARVSRNRERATMLVSFNGQAAVSLAVNKIGFTNTIELVESLKQYIATRNTALAGSGVQLILADDQTIPTRDAINVMEVNAALGLSLVLLVCWLFLGLRIALMVTLGIAFSIAGTLWALKATGNTLNVSVLLGLVIVLGMLVDDAVVVVEAIYYRIQRGTAALEAAMSALGEVARPVASAVATTIAAFLPLMLLPGIIGKFMFVIPFVVTVGLAVSLVEAFWILPAHVISAGSPQQAGRHTINRDWRWRWTHWIRIRYTRLLIAVMRRPSWLLSGAGAAVVGAAIALQVGMVKMDFFTFDPIRLFYIYVDMPADSPLKDTLAETQRVERLARQHINPTEARAITVLTGVKFTEMEPLYGDQYGQIQVALNPRDGGRSVSQIVESLRPILTTIATNAEISFLQLSGGPPAARPISVKVRSDDFDQLRAAADDVRQLVENIPGAFDVTDNDVAGRPELTATVDYRAALESGMDPFVVARLLKLHLDGEVVAFVRSQGEKVELRVRGPERSLADIRDILRDPVALPTGGITTLGALVNTTIGDSRATIRHYNLRRTITVEADLNGELDTRAANKLLMDGWGKIAANYPDTNLDFSGELDDINESLDAMFGLFLLGLGLIYLILATQFRSYFQPMLILATVPMAFVGVVIGLVVTGNPMSLYTLYGVIALTGIAVNSAIVLIDAANQRIAAGMRPLHAAIYAGRRRVIPIMMTTTTTIAGLFSLAVGLGGESLLWGPVASSIVAGLAVASFLTLLIIPTLYRLFMMNLPRRRRNKRHQSRNLGHER